MSMAHGHLHVAMFLLSPGELYELYDALQVSAGISFSYTAQD